MIGRGSGFLVSGDPVLPPIQVSAEKKPTGSTVGMQTSVATSTLLKVGLLGTVETRAPPKASLQREEWSAVPKVGLPPVGGWLRRSWAQTCWQRVCPPTQPLAHLAVPG